MDVHDIHRSHRTALLVVVVFVCIVAIALSTATFILYERQQDAIDAARRAEYRICVRQQINRAAIDLPHQNDEPHLPLYDCTPNLKGKPARRLSPAEATALEDHVRYTPESQLP